MLENLKIRVIGMWKLFTFLKQNFNVVNFLVISFLFMYQIIIFKPLLLHILLKHRPNKVGISSREDILIWYLSNLFQWLFNLMPPQTPFLPDWEKYLIPCLWTPSLSLWISEDKWGEIRHDAELVASPDL